MLSCCPTAASSSRKTSRRSPASPPAHLRRKGSGDRQESQRQANDQPDQPVSITDGTGELRTLEAIERDLIQFAIDHYSGHMSEVARRLGIGRSTLYRKVREYDLKVREDGDDLDEVG